MKCQACEKQAMIRRWIRPFSAAKMEVNLCDECKRLGGVKIFERIARKNKENIKYV